jgi:hypothetical protein
MKEYIDRIEVMRDIMDGEIEITGECAEFAQDAVEGYRSVILKRLMVQPTEDVIPVEWIRKQADVFQSLLILWESEKKNADD